MDNKPTFKHDFKTIFGVVNIAGAQGYMQALNAVSKHIVDKAIQKDNALYVNASELMELIKNTSEELAVLVDAELNSFSQDNLFEKMVNITKQHAKDTYGIDLDKKDDISNVL